MRIALGVGNGKPGKQSAGTPFRLDVPVDWKTFTRALRSAGYTAEALRETVDLANSGGRLDVAKLLHRTARLTPHHSLVHLFFLAREVPVQAARRSLPLQTLSSLVDLGLLRKTPAGVRSRAGLAPWQDLFLVHDFELVNGKRPALDHVVAPGTAARWLNNLTVRRQAGSALDLATGSGILAFLASRHAAEVIATDISARAIHFATLNARLNGISRVQFRQGDLYDPVAGQTFDLIVCNPPFIISPSLRCRYRESGLPGDEMSQRVIRGAAARLNEGGYGAVLFDWHHRREHDWADRPAAWLRDTGCDAWLLLFQTQDAVGYASNRLGHCEEREPAQYQRQLDRWLRYYQQAGIDWLSLGAVIFRRRGLGRNWFRSSPFYDIASDDGTSAQIQRMFAAVDLLESLEDDRQLLDCRLALVPGYELEEFCRVEKGAENQRGARLKQTHGFGFIRTLEPSSAAIFRRCDGRRSLNELLKEVCNGQRAAPRLISQVLEGARKLLVSGFFLTRGN